MLYEDIRESKSFHITDYSIFAPWLNIWFETVWNVLICVYLVAYFAMLFL
jgi:hypothetical protein